MERAGSASWRFAEGIEQMPLVALFVRDAVGLDVPAGAVIPPPLDGDLPDHSMLLDSERRAAAGANWTGWWEMVVAQDVRQHQGSPDSLDHSAWMLELTVEHRAVFDPPEFASLADRPALHEAVQAVFEEALRWADERRRALLFPPSGRPSQFDYDTTRAVAEEVARRRQVSPGAVRACAVVLPVRGHWWQRCAPGAVLCSVHAARRTIAARAMLTDAFESRLAS